MLTENRAVLISVRLAVLLLSCPLRAQTMAEKYPPRAEDLRPTSGWAPQFRRPVGSAVRERAPLRVDWADNELSESVVTFGVPFARGAKADVRNLHVIDDTGRSAPAGFRAVATWDGPGGPTRWALGHARLRKGVDHFLEFGSAVKPAAATGVEVKEAPERVTVNTGPMRVSISKSRATVVESVALDLNGDGRFADAERIVADDGSAELPVVVDGRNVPHHATDVKAEVVESGPLRAAVRREGWYTDARGARFCKFVTYTYFFAGEAGLRHDHTLIAAFDTNQRRIRNVMLPVPLRVSQGAMAVFATDESPRGGTAELDAAKGPFGLVQSRHDRWELLGPAGAVKKGDRAGGWCGLKDERWGAWAGLRDSWQQCPGELEVGRDTIRLHLYPARAVGPLDFRPSAVLGADYPGDHCFHGPFYTEGLDEMTQGYGLGKTHNIHLSFFASRDAERARNATRAQTVRPVLALPDPAYSCSTEALFGRMHPRDPERFPEVEKLIDSVVETYYDQRESQEQYGWIDFGDVHNTGQLWRRWASMFYGFPNVMPRLYLRSGRREAWDFHRVNTRHITDIDICHLDNDTFPEFGRISLKKEKGRRYGGNGGIVHYAADQYKVGPDHHIEFMLMDYYLNGNLRTWEVANDYLEVHAAAREEAWAMNAYRHRSTGGALRFFCEGYLATWNPEYLSIMRQCADILYKAWEEDGVIRRDDVYMNPAKIMYYQITGEERMREGFLKDMTALSRQRDLHGSSSGGRGATLSGLAHAYWFTGDEKYLPFLAWQLKQLKEKDIAGLHGNYVARFATHGYQLPQVAALLADVDKLPEPRGPAVPEATECPLALTTNGAYYLHEEKDGEFILTLTIDLYRGYGKAFQNREEWLAQLTAAERPAMRLIGPGGNEVQRVELTPENTVKKLVKLTQPADGATGTYVLVPSSTPAPISVWLVDSTLKKRVVQAGENWIAPITGRYYRRIEKVAPRSLFFLVPAGTGKFRLESKSAILRSAIQYGVRNAAGEIVAEGEWRNGANPRNDWDVAELDAGRPKKDEIWSLTLGFQAVGETYVRFTGVPGYVASAPDELFAPDSALRRQAPAAEVPPGEEPVVYVDTDLPWGGRAAYLRKPFVLKASGGGKPMLNARQGTVELWVKPVDPPTYLANRTLVTCGGFHIMRRLNLGTYAFIAGVRFDRYFALPSNRWTHLAVTWKPSPNENADVEVRIYADGIDTGPKTLELLKNKVPEGWPGNELIVNDGIFVGGLRVSDTVRYEQNFSRPGAPFEADEQTRVLYTFDGSGEAWLFGKKRAIR